MRHHLLLFSIASLFFAINLSGQQRLTVSGNIHDESNGEALIGSTVYVKELATGAQSNEYGFYSLSIMPGTYTLEFRYVGYETLVKEIELLSEITLNIELIPENQLLNEIIIEAGGASENVENVTMSVNRLDINTIQKMPAFLGEVDIIKSINLLPGVSSVGEGSAGFNVRGGSVGQNLILLDEAPVYNSSHLLGFFSVFNPDAVRDVKLYRGGIQARYGGRIASILDIRMKEGNNKQLSVNGGIGSIFSRLTVEAPIIKNKSSFIISGRRSYADILFRPFVEVLQDGARLNFYDLTMKANYDFDQKDKLYLSGYLGRDIFGFDKRQGFSWGNRTATIRWNHLYSHHLFMNLTGLFSDYDYSLKFGENELDKFEWKSHIRTLSLKPDFSAFYGLNNVISFGGEISFMHFYPAEIEAASNGFVTSIRLDDKYSLESALYLSNEHHINDAWVLEYGIRTSDFRYLGPGTSYKYRSIIPGERKVPVEAAEYDRFETIKDYFSLEPRASLNYMLDDKSSIKGSYNRMTQNVHLVSNTTASNPLDIWIPSTNNIKPEIGHQFTMGYFRNFADNRIETSVEGYYKSLKNQVDYIDGADLFINEFIEGELLFGNGRAYGLEFFMQKREGRINGWLSYTLSRTELKVGGINKSDWYPARYDQTHNLKAAAFFEIHPQWSLSGNFTFLSGTPTTFPTSRYQVQDYLIPYNAAESRNNVRIPDYHRLDLSIAWEGKKLTKNGKERKINDSVVFSLYNVYARKNPFSIYFTQSSERPENGDGIDSMAKMVSIIGTIIPSITYNFKFQ